VSPEPFDSADPVELEPSSEDDAESDVAVGLAPWSAVLLAVPVLSPPAALSWSSVSVPPWVRCAPACSVTPGMMAPGA
jgi:hypothetical protein